MSLLATDSYIVDPILVNVAHTLNEDFLGVTALDYKMRKSEMNKEQAKLYQASLAGKYADFIGSFVAEVCEDTIVLLRRHQ